MFEVLSLWLSRGEAKEYGFTQRPELEAPTEKKINGKGRGGGTISISTETEDKIYRNSFFRGDLPSRMLTRKRKGENRIDFHLVVAR